MRTSSLTGSRWPRLTADVREISACSFISSLVVWLQLPTLEMSEYWNCNTDRLMFSRRRLQMSQRNTLLEREYGFLEIRVINIWPKHPGVPEVSIVLTSRLGIQSTRSRRTRWAMWGWRSLSFNLTLREIHQVTSHRKQQHSVVCWDGVSRSSLMGIVYKPTNPVGRYTKSQSGSYCHSVRWVTEVNPKVVTTDVRFLLSNCFVKATPQSNQHTDQEEAKSACRDDRNPSPPACKQKRHPVLSCSPREDITKHLPLESV